LNFGIWIRDDGWSRSSGTYRIKVTIRFRVRRSERFVEEEKFKKELRGFVYPKSTPFLTLDYCKSNFSLDRGNIGCPTFPGGGWYHEAMPEGGNGVYLTVTMDGKEISEKLVVYFIAEKT
jgi:hypothetical protein